MAVMNDVDTGDRGRSNDEAVPAKRVRHEKFWRKYLRLTRAGIMVLRALDIVGQEERDDAFRKVIGDIHARVERGVPLSKAILEHQPEFSLSEIEMIRTAEKRGAWDEVLEELADGLRDGTFE
jgi:type II secretory pathway component PulF